MLLLWMSGDYSIDVNHQIDVSRYHLGRETKLSRIILIIDSNKEVA